MVAALLAGGVCAVSACSRSESSSTQPSGPVLVVDHVPTGIHKTSLEFGGKIRLLGYTVNRRPMHAGKPVTMTLYWQTSDKVEPGYTPVTQIFDDAGERLLDLNDAGPLREKKDGHMAMPPESWQPGKIYVDELSFTVPKDVKTWRIQIATGFAKGDEKMKYSDSDSIDGLAVVATSGTGVKESASRTPKVPNLRVDQLDAKTKLKVDGKLDEDAWKQAPVNNLVDASTGGKPNKAPVKGSVRLLSTAQGFYVGFDVQDQNVIGGFPKTAKDPHLWTKDTVEIMVDPDGDGDNLDYYEIQINPQGLVFDSQYDKYNDPRKEPDGPFGHEEWTSNVKAAVTVQGTIDKSDDKDEGYVVEAFVPWKSFDKAKKTPPAMGDTWRMNFYAMQDNSGVAWSPILKHGNFHKASRFGRVLWAEKGWTEAKAAPSTATANNAANAPANKDEATAANPRPLPSGIVERLNSAKTKLAASALPPPAPAPSAK